MCARVCALLGLWSLCFDTVKLTAAASNVLVRLLKTRLATGSKVLALLWRTRFYVNRLQQLWLSHKCDVFSCDAEVVCLGFVWPLVLSVKVVLPHRAQSDCVFFLFSCLVLGQECDVYNGRCGGHYSFTMCTALSDSVPDFLHSEADCVKQVIVACVQNSSPSLTL